MAKVMHSKYTKYIFSGKTMIYFYFHNRYHFELKTKRLLLGICFDKMNEKESFKLKNNIINIRIKKQNGILKCDHHHHVTMYKPIDVQHFNIHEKQSHMEGQLKLIYFLQGIL